MTSSVRVLTFVTLVLMITAALTAPALGAQLEKAKVISTAQCPSNALVIELNVESRSSRRDLLKAMKAASEAAMMTVTVIPSAAEKIAMRAELSAECAKDEACVAQSGWALLQYRLHRLQGVKVACDMPHARQKNEASPMPGSATERGGSITGSN